LLCYITEHDAKLKQSCPCFFDRCIPGISEDFKFKVFYNCSGKSTFNLKLCIVVDVDGEMAELSKKFAGFSKLIFD